MPENYRIGIIGPPCSGKKTLAQMLHERYGWKILNLEQIYSNVIVGQKAEISNPKPSNPDGGSIHASIEELQRLLVG